MSKAGAAKVAGGAAESQLGIGPAEPGVVPPGLMRAEDAELVRQLGERAQAQGLRLTGEGGLLARLAKIVIEGALEGEMDAHLGYGKHDPAGRDGGNSRNGHRAKTVLQAGFAVAGGQAVRTFAASLVTAGQIAFDEATSRETAPEEAQPTHRVVTRDGSRLLERIRFA